MLEGDPRGDEAGTPDDDEVGRQGGQRGAGQRWIGALAGARRRGRRDGHGPTLGSAAGAVKPRPRARRRVRINRHRARAAGATVASDMDEIATALLPTARRDDCIALDRADPLAALRDEFVLPEGVIYLDGNSLGALPRRTAARVADVAAHEWGEGLIRSWNDAGWIDLPQRIGDKIAALIGARPGEVVVADSTSLNLFKSLSAAVALQGADAPARRVILSERGNFP